MKTLTLELGALCEPVSKQLAGRVSSEELESFDLMADAVLTCCVHGLLTEYEAHRARKRLVVKISNAMADAARQSTGEQGTTHQKLSP